MDNGEDGANEIDDFWDFGTSALNGIVAASPTTALPASLISDLDLVSWRVANERPD
jgi:hypothetical protein